MFKALDLWLPAYLRNRRPRPQAPGPTHVLLCVCDHFEPFHHADKAKALERMAEWNREFPGITQEFRAADGVGPRHTFFYPIEQYDVDILQSLAQLCAASGGETEIHLHHRDDTAESLTKKLEAGKEKLAGHGLLARDAQGRMRYGFIHGDWALDNSHPKGRHCGVSNELKVLRDTGCYADFTMPSAPSRTQTRIINSLYYATGTPQPKSHDRGVPAKVRGKDDDRAPGDLLLVQGPLALNWSRRKWGVLPRIENGDITGANPPTFDRLRLWLELGIHVQGRPDWVFIKLHTHGAISQNRTMLLGDAMRQFHRQLAEDCRATGNQLHYVTARELVNILHAAEEGCSGDPGAYRNHRYTLNRSAA